MRVSKRVGKTVTVSREQLERAIDMVKSKSKPPRPSRIRCHSDHIQRRIMCCCQTPQLENSDHALPSRTQSLMMLMKRAVFKHDWTTAARCLQNVTKVGIVNPAPRRAVWRVLMLILLNHRSSSESIVLELMEQILGITNEKEIEMCIMRLLTLPPNLSEYDRQRSGNKGEYYDDDDGDISFVDSD